ncbi:MFS transporter [Trichococcus collinsii]|uniref:MFS transporter, DHA1 family, tetracycline resistance protein n=1 Tax=Trichococcus collinsii TaxID=157076 RepID=A0AB38A2Q7_9LACT|nr:MFS transporter [Trichococcus collinsii]CZR00507.1 sugar transport proteins signature 1 [Trichococcus collinsii]SEA82450.1 MFS transporter, DHA1 family, tetracycline resistance protein [Trichococcus collinsii]
MKNDKANPILPIFFTVFIDLLGLGIIIPILPAVILNPMAGLLPMEYDFSLRTIIYGFLIASYPLMQFFGAPMLGALADRMGRRKILLASLLGTLGGYLLIAIGILTHNIWLLFIGRAIDGFTGGNISIAQSAIADISDDSNRAKNFGLIGMAFGLGFVIGPYLGGKLSDPSILSWFDFATPFWFAAVLTAINILMVLKRFPETLKNKKTGRIDPLAGVKNIRKAFEIKQLRTIFAVIFLLTVGFNFFTQFFQVFLVGKFQFNQSQIGDLFAYMGIWIAAAQGAFLRPLSKRFSPMKILSVSSILLAATFPFLLLPDQAGWIYVIIPFIAIFQGLTQPNSTAIVSSMSDRSSQGEILGINQSIVSLAQALPPILAAFLTTINMNLPTLFAAGSTLAAWIVFVFVFKRSTVISETAQQSE